LAVGDLRLYENVRSGGGFCKSMSCWFTRTTACVRRQAAMTINIQACRTALPGTGDEATTTMKLSPA